ncbi:MAG: phosphoribosylformylglycinamidine synthase [Pseudomonadota bacterium]
MAQDPPAGGPAPAHLTLAGTHALDPFRLERRLQRIRDHAPGVAALDARFVYYLDCDGSLDDEAWRRLRVVLNDDVAPNPIDDAGFEVAPRAGTISPWSSKATDILRRCGIAGVRRVERGIRYRLEGAGPAELAMAEPELHDRMTEQCYLPGTAAALLFEQPAARPLVHIPLGDDAQAALAEANVSLGLALSADEIDYLADHYTSMGRPPTDAELMMFAQANSEHCRHKIFNASWTLDGEPQSQSLFQMIKNTTAHSPGGVISAYSDNAAVLAGPSAPRLFAKDGRHYGQHDETVDILCKVETHNHPTAIAPFPGAATGAGGEIRDEGATGLGAVPKAGLTGFTTSDLEVPGWPQPWERFLGKPSRIVSSMEIMLEGPIGGAAFNNEFGRPNLGGYFRTFLAETGRDAEHWGYHKPIMIAGGLGNVRREHALKRDVAAGSLLVVLGGPAMLIGLGGGAASSVASGQSDAALDFASVQRGNPEMQRRAQEVINQCWALGDDNPIALIHDVGAGGLSNAVPEAVDHSGLGGAFALDAIPSDDPSMSPMETWCNESQERYVLIVEPDNLATFEAFCERERCPYAVLGALHDDGRLRVDDASRDASPVDLDMGMLLGKPPKLAIDAKRVDASLRPFDANSLPLGDALDRVLTLPAVADKRFLIHIGDRSVGGLVARDQLVGPWQVPVADVAVTTATHASLCGEAMAMGERSPVACEDAPAAARLAITEAITNLLAADVAALSDIKLSANWMAAAGHRGQDAALFDAVRTVGLELCPALGIAVPVGKDSLSMKTAWQRSRGEAVTVVAPVSLVVTAFAPVGNARDTLTPELVAGDTRLLLIDLAQSPTALGRSALAQVYSEQGGAPADLSSAEDVLGFARAWRRIRDAKQVLAAHDRSDGGLIVAAVEMLLAGRRGVVLTVPDAEKDTNAWLFSEGPGMVLQVSTAVLEEVRAAFAAEGLAARTHEVGTVTAEAGGLEVQQRGRTLASRTRTELQQQWSALSFRMQARRDNPDTAREEFEALLDDSDPGLHARLSFDPDDDVAAPFVARGAKPRVAVLREQGVNSQLEMASALMAAGFEAHDVHMSDLERGLVQLDDYAALVACGGFSYGDVLGAGGGWAKSILLNAAFHDAFASFFARPDTLALGICNGCQMLARLAPIIPGATGWPTFAGNRSAQFEARLSMVEVTGSGPWLEGMGGSRLPIVTSHAEGRAVFAEGDLDQCKDSGRIAMRYITNTGEMATRYPANPNGSPRGVAALTNADGRVLVSMPHPERVARTVQHSWHPSEWGEAAPWLRLFRNARVALG